MRTTKDGLNLIGNVFDLIKEDERNQRELKTIKNDIEQNRENSTRLKDVGIALNKHKEIDDKMNAMFA